MGKTRPGLGPLPHEQRPLPTLDTTPSCCSSLLGGMQHTCFTSLRCSRRQLLLRLLPRTMLLAILVAVTRLHRGIGRLRLPLVGSSPFRDLHHCPPLSPSPPDDHRQRPRPPLVPSPAPRPHRRQDPTRPSEFGPSRRSPRFSLPDLRSLVLVVEDRVRK